MKRITTIVASLVLIVGLAGCGSSEQTGNESTVEQTEVVEGVGPDSDLGTEELDTTVATTELPAGWSSDIPVPPNGTIESATSDDGYMVVTWVAPMGDIEVLTTDYANALNAAGFSEGEFEAADVYGFGQFSNATHAVTVSITAIEETMIEYLVTYEPRLD